jgi:hypothetical protein
MLSDDALLDEQLVTQHVQSSATYMVCTAMHCLLPCYAAGTHAVLE